MAKKHQVIALTLDSNTFIINQKLTIELDFDSTIGYIAIEGANGVGVTFTVDDKAHLRLVHAQEGDPLPIDPAVTLPIV